MIVVNLIQIGMRSNMKGLWLPSILWVLAESFYNQFFYVVFKNTEKPLKIATLTYVVIFLTEMTVPFLAFSTKLFTTFNVIGSFYCIVPVFGYLQAFFKIMFRHNWRDGEINEDANLDPWGP